jgi:small subunit ribosomal protein S7
MSRRHSAAKREVLPDPKFGDLVLSRFMNVLMYDGKKSTAERIVYAAMDALKRRVGPNGDPLRMFHEAMDNVKPAVEVRSRRVGGATYQVPVEVRPERSVTLALRWLVSFSKARREKTMVERLANEILDASNGLGAAVKRREDTHKMAEANRAFAHYRW